MSGGGGAVHGAGRRRLARLFVLDMLQLFEFERFLPDRARWPDREALQTESD